MKKNGNKTKKKPKQELTQERKEKVVEEEAGKIMEVKERCIRSYRKVLREVVENNGNKIKGLTEEPKEELVKKEVGNIV